MMTGLLTLEMEMNRYAIEPLYGTWLGARGDPLCLTGLVAESGQPIDNHAISS